MWAEATACFARGLGAAHLDQRQQVDASLARLAVLENTAAKAGEDLFARSIQVLRLELSAWSAHQQGQQQRSVTLMREAAALEAATPKHAVTPGPTLPAAELLGDLYMEQHNPAAALESYRRSLTLYPERFNSFLGAARAAARLDDIATAREMYSQLVRLSAHGTRQGPIDEAKQALARAD